MSCRVTETLGDPGVLPRSINEDDYSILQEVEVAVKLLQKGTSAGIDNVQGCKSDPSRRRSHDQRPLNNLPQDLVGWGMANMVLGCQSTQERQPTAVLQLSHNQPHQPPQQSLAENPTE